MHSQSKTGLDVLAEFILVSPEEKQRRINNVKKTLENLPAIIRGIDNAISNLPKTLNAIGNLSRNFRTTVPKRLPQQETLPSFDLEAMQKKKAELETQFFIEYPDPRKHSLSWIHL